MASFKILKLIVSLNLILFIDIKAIIMEEAKVADMRPTAPYLNIITRKTENRTVNKEAPLLF